MTQKTFPYTAVLKYFKVLYSKKKKKMDFILYCQLSLKTNKGIDWASSMGRADVCLPKKGQKEGNQVMVGVLWQAATARGRHHRDG